MKRYRFDPASVSLTITVGDSSAPASTWVYQGSSGLEYKTSTEAQTLGDRIPDFSGVGYLKGEALPSLSDVGGELVELSHTAGDQTTRIQAAIDGMANHPINESTGYRGTLRLGAGTWQVSSTLNIGVSGVVLQGVGGSAAGGTVISALESGGFADGISSGAPVLLVAGTNQQFSTSTSVAVDASGGRVPVGATTVTVNDASSFTVGDEIIVESNPNDAWIAAVRVLYSP